MKILAIETSSECASVALMVDHLTLQYPLEGHANHSALLLAAVERLLAEAQLTLPALDALAFGAGPGAFTGLRLACAVAQGLAMGADVGVVPVDSLKALAMQSPVPLAFVATDARMNETYSGAYRLCEGLPETVREPLCLPPGELTLPFPGEWFALGSAFEAYEKALDGEDVGMLIGMEKKAWPQAREVVRIAAYAVSQGDVLAPEQAAPVYVRNKVALTTAEQKARKRHA